jgi:NAD-dependent deacetylase
LTQFANTGEIPCCPVCSGILKPNAVLFGEQLPYDVFCRAVELIAQSDLILVAGSSLEVTPVCTLPVEPLNAGAQLIIVNEEPTYLDERAELIFRQDVALVLPRIATEVLGESG